MVAYGVWAVVLVIGFVVKGQPLRAPAYFLADHSAKTIGRTT